MNFFEYRTAPIAIRSNHYELAFEAYLRGLRRPYVAVNENRRALVEEMSLKSMDFIVYAPARPHLLVDVKGRRFVRSGDGGHPWENWATADDVECLLRWETCFGEDFRAAFVFAYDVEAEAAEGFPELFRFRDRAYAFYVVWVSEYLQSMRQRSQKWETVSLPAADYRRLRRPLDQLLNVTLG
ncbi:MAG TPA: HYExAFE family protein [Caulifigura sp.]|nr:HYExAFE family protein [Caulifigura sp.]